MVLFEPPHPPLSPPPKIKVLVIIFSMTACEHKRKKYVLTCYRVFLQRHNEAFPEKESTVFTFISRNKYALVNKVHLESGRLKI